MDQLTCSDIRHKLLTSYAHGPLLSRFRRTNESLSSSSPVSSSSESIAKTLTANLRQFNTNGYNHFLSTYNPTFASFVPTSTSLPSYSSVARGDLCGRRYIQRSSKVVGGNDTYLGEFPWTVSVRRSDHHHCGGVIVSNKWILTAAHCVQSRVPSNFVIRIGEYDLHKAEKSSKDYTVDKIVIHDNYSGLIKSSLTSINGADIALLRTKVNITMNEYAWPVCFPSNEATSYAGLEAIVVGWGKRNEESNVFSSKLQKVRLPIIDNKICKNWFKMANREMAINDKIICAGFKDGGKDACHGDSGGPLLAKINNQWSVIGVVSTGIGCAKPLLPGLYSRVSSYYKWIEKHTNSE